MEEPMNSTADFIEFVWHTHDPEEPCDGNCPPGDNPQVVEPAPRKRPLWVATLDKVLAGVIVASVLAMFASAFLLGRVIVLWLIAASPVPADFLAASWVDVLPEGIAFPIVFRLIFGSR
jgi:hypothetical protein